MAADPEKLQIGQGDIWIGGTAPAGGVDLNDPTSSTLNAMTSGFANPVSGGTYVGLTNGPATLAYRPTYYMVESEQSFAEVATTPTAEESTLTFSMQEVRSYTNLGFAFGQGTTEAIGGTGNALYLGSKPTLATKVLTLLSQHQDLVGYFLLTMYKAYSGEGSSLNFERRAESRLPVTARAQADLSRPKGDQLLQLADYDANPA